MAERRALGHVERDPRPVTDLGRQALSSIVRSNPFELSEEEATLMAYDGYPDIQAALVAQTEPPQNPNTYSEAPKQEPLNERIARTRYIATITPQASKSRRPVSTLTTKAL